MPRWPTFARLSVAFAVISGPCLLPGCGADAEEKPQGLKRPPEFGDATVRSVDGPARLTLSTAGGSLKVRLHLVDAPEPGECGAAESTAALEQLVRGRKARVRYGTWGSKVDAEGRVQALVGPRGADLTERTIARDLVDTEWARTFPSTTINEMDNLSLTVAAETWAPRKAQGVWARCGGRMHLPLDEQAPAHAPPPWKVSAKGFTEAIGPIVLPQTLGAAKAMTVADFEQYGTVEAVDIGQPECWARLPSAELVLRARKEKPGATCRTASIVAISTSGPSEAATSRGVAVSGTEADAKAAFPRLTTTKPKNHLLDGWLPLAGYDHAPAPWATLARLGGPSDTIDGFYTAPTEP